MKIIKSDINIKELIERETGERFNRNNKMCCHLHNEKTPSFSIEKDLNIWKCFGCGKGGDAIQFIREYKNMDYVQACNYLGIELDKERQQVESNKEKVIKKALGCFKDHKLIDIYQFTNEVGEVVYYKVKLLPQDSKNKITPYFSIVNNKVEAKRNHEEIPYNLYEILRAITNNKDIFIVEGEKDAETLKYLGYKATSLKGITKFNYSAFTGAKVYFVGDTGEAGEKYKHNCWEALKDYVEEFNIVELKGLEQLGDNKDITDWIEAGYTKEDFKEALRDVWDWKKSRSWRYVKEIKKQGKTVVVPLKIWQNLDLLLKREGISLKYNVISKEVEATGKLTSTRNTLLTDIYTLNQVKGLGISREEVKNSIDKIANENSYNPFIEYLEEVSNENYSVINDVFNCIEIEQESWGKIDLYKTYFTKWLLNVVRMAGNTLEKGYGSQGVIVLQGGQGCYKTTFFKTLLPYHNWFKADKIIDPSNKDSIRENTKYILVEFGELDATLKGDQAKLKAFLTSDSDEYRSPYAVYEERHPRLTSYCATVNKKSFLKDETGSRRFWVIPVEQCNIEKLKQINIDEFWGAVYSLYKSNKIDYWLTKEENEALSVNNMQFNVENDISITLDDAFDWEQSPLLWKVYTVTELCNLLDIKEKKAFKNEMERRKIRFGTHRDNYRDGVKKGYKLPNIDKQQAKNMAKNLKTIEAEMPF